MRWVIAVCLLCLGAAAGATTEPNWGTWAEEVRKQHPLAGSFYVVAPAPPSAGRLWQPPVTTVFGNYDLDDRGDGRLFRPGPPDGRGLVLPMGIVLLGEVHDNPAHHQVRAWLIENSANAIRGWRPAVVFEQVRVDQQAALDRFRALAETSGGSAGVEDLFRLLEWDKSGWPPAQVYRPLFHAVIAARLPIYAGDPPRERVRAVARGAPLPKEDLIRLQLDSEMPRPLLDALQKELRDGHCGVIPESALAGMGMAQRYRDAHLAHALLTAAERHGSAILIAGNGHVRSDRGVPRHIRERSPESRVMSVLLVEVEEGRTDPKLYLPRDPEGKPAADLLIFTPRAERDDPCEKMRKMKRQ